MLKTSYWVSSDPGSNLDNYRSVNRPQIWLVVLQYCTLHVCYICCYVDVRALWEETDLVKLDPELPSALQRRGERVQVLPPKRKELLNPQTAQSVVSRVPDAVLLPHGHHFIIHVQRILGGEEQRLITTEDYSVHVCVCVCVSVCVCVCLWSLSQHPEVVQLLKACPETCSWSMNTPASTAHLCFYSVCTMTLFR